VVAGAGLITFSGDKLLGGPQAGLVVGRAELVERVRRHPLYRALRPDKLTLAALEATLALYRDPTTVHARVPALRMIAAPLDALERRAEALAATLRGVPGLDVAVEAGTSRVGGGSYAAAELPTRVVSLLPAALSVDALAARLRAGEPAVFARIARGRLCVDPRTLLGPDEDRAVAGAIATACAAG